MAAHLYEDTGWRGTEATVKRQPADVLPLDGAGTYWTTVVVRNIPKQLSTEEILITIDDRYQGSYNFFFAAMNSRSGENDGKVTINFRSVQVARHFKHNFWGLVNWGNGVAGADRTWCYTSWAMNQGTATNMDKHDCAKYFLANIPEDFRPLVFNQDGARRLSQQVFGCTQQKYLPQAVVGTGMAGCADGGKYPLPQPLQKFKDKPTDTALDWMLHDNLGEVGAAYQCCHCGATFHKWLPCLMHIVQTPLCNKATQGFHGNISNSMKLQYRCCSFTKPN